MVYQFINNTDVIGVILGSATQNTTGSIVVTLLIVLLLLLAICLMFQIPFEFTAILVLPMCITMGAYYSNLLGPVFVIIIYLSIIFTKNWLFR